MTSTWVKVVGLALLMCALLVWRTATPALGGPGEKAPPVKGPGSGEQAVEPIADMTVPHLCGGAASLDGKLYVWGGYSSGGELVNDRTKVCEVYEPGKNAWRRLADFPAGRSSPGAFALNGRLYSIGGEGPSGSFSNGVFRYDPAADKWAELKPFPAPAWDPICVVAGGKAYAIGGRHGYGQTESQVFVYDEDKDSWRRKADMPHSGMELACAVVDGRIYVVGGQHKESEGHSESLQVVQIYDPAKDAWTIEKLGWRPVQHKAVELDGELWVIARSRLDEKGQAVPGGQVTRYSPARNSWVHFDFRCPEEVVNKNPMTVIDGQVYFTAFQEPSGKQFKTAVRLDLKRLAGSAPTGATRDLDEADILRWLKDHPEAAGRIIKQLQASPAAAKCLQFEEMAGMSVPHMTAGVVALKDRLYVWSGYSTEGRRNYDRTTALEIFDCEKNAWRKGADLPSGRNSLVGFALDGKIYSIGGEASPSGSFTNNVYRYDPAADKWAELKPFPNSICDSQCMICAGKAYVISGRRGYGGTEKDVYVYDVEKDAWQKLADIPTSLMYGAVAAIEDRIYVFGGVHGESESERSYLKTLQIYDTAKDQWTTEEMPVRMYCPRAVKVDGEVWLFAPKLLDESGKDLPCPWAFRYSPVARRWTQYRIDKPELLSPRVPPLVALDGRVYFTEINENDKRTTKVLRLDLRNPGPGEPVEAAAAALKKPAEPVAYGTTLTFTKVMLNDKALDVDRPTITVKPGANIAGKVELHVNRLGPATSIFPVAGTVSWDRTERAAISQHLPPGEHDVVYEVNKKAPAKPGTYWILVSAGPLYNIDEILGCNHEPAHGGPKGGPYDLGNSMWDWKPDQFDQAFRGDPVDCIWNGKPGNQALARAVKVVVTAE